MQALGVEAHLYDVFSCRYIHRAQDVVGTGYRSRIAIDGGCPSVGIIDLGEHGNAVRRVLAFVDQSVGFVLFQPDDSQRIGFSCLRIVQQCFETAVHNGSLQWLYVVQGINLFVGIGYVAYLFYKPGMAVGARIEYGQRLTLFAGREDEVACVQHVEYAELRCISTLQLPLCCHHFGIDGLHLGGNVSLYHLLVAT